MASLARTKSTHVRLPDQVTHDISVVIVSFNTREMTMECVRSVLADAGDLSVEIIVVDNQSNDGSSDALREEFSEITVIDSPANGGFAYGNTIGFEQAHGEFVLLLNPDTQIFRGCLVKALNFMKANSEAGIMGPRVRLPDGTQQSSMIRFLDLTQLFFIMFIPSLWLRKTSLFGDLRYAGLSREEVQEVDAVSGCFMFARREMIDQIGALDTRFFMYGEEAEWCFRARDAGWRVMYNPSVEILHHGAASTAHMSIWKAIEMTRGHILFLRFTRGDIVARAGLALMIVRDLIRAPYYGLSIIASGGSSTQAAKAWWARLKFELRSLLRLPAGQTIALPDPAAINK